MPVDKPRLESTDLKLKIAELWRTGMRGRWNMCAELRKTYSVDSRRVTAAYNELEAELKEYTKELQEDRLSILTDEAQLTYRDAIVSDLEIEVVLSSIVTGSCGVEQFVEGKAVIRDITPTEMINAAKLLWQKRGALAPVKVAETDKDGNEVVRKTELTTSQFEELVKRINATSTD